MVLNDAWSSTILFLRSLLQIGAIASSGRLGDVMAREIFGTCMYGESGTLPKVTSLSRL